VIMNIWCDICLDFSAWALTCCRAILHDPVVYPEPDVFKPERFINQNGSLRDDPVLASVFGYGKRICPGRHLADATLFIVIASLLSVFNIKKSDGTVDGGPDMYPFTGHLLRYGHHVSVRDSRGANCWSFLSAPCPFTCSIIPRDGKAEELIASDAQAQ
jgi:hypothetical protein